MNIGLIFPHQLFHDHPVLEHTNKVYLIEDSLFFGDKHNPLKFHKQKLVFHRASMQAYKQQLEDRNIIVHYIEYQSDQTIINSLPELDGHNIFCVDPTDYLLQRRLERRFKTNITLLDSPLFINSQKDNQDYLEDGKIFMQEFYKFQRKRLGILIDSKGKPTGGKWSFDDENRKKVPKSHYSDVPADPRNQSNEYIDEAINYVQENFSDNYGRLNNFTYVVTRKEALEMLDNFCNERLHLFGDYEDAIVKDRGQLYHSILSPYINIGLLTPMEVVEKVLEYSAENNIPMNNTEGIVRQIIGWREFIRMVYEHHGTSLRTSNEWNHTENIGSEFYTGTTGIDPIDATITKTLDTAYNHHIERLMVMGNFFFLNKINPDHIYNWFMEMYIDAYDWVMVPNVYGMVMQTQKELMVTKPYISGSNYIKKMSDYSAGSWTKIWDALYWNTIIEHLDELTRNGRMHFVTARAKKFTSQEKKEYAETAKAFYRSHNRT